MQPASVSDFSHPGAQIATAGARWSRLVEAAFLLLVCLGLFGIGLGRHDFIKTEGLRAIVAGEMLGQPGLSMPSVHHRPQTKKPPLYAWTTTLLARAANRLDEQIARVPSAVAGTLLILLLYGVGEGCLGRGAGVPAAALGLANATILDYSMRAELDMGFTLLTTVAILLAYPALYRGGGLGALCWLGCYAAATLAAMWKGPHSLIFLWVPLLAYGWRKKEWRWLRNPAQVIGLLLSLGVLIGWTRLLSGHAGQREVGNTAVIELFSRLIPHSGEDVLSILYAVPLMVFVAIPASLFILASFRNGVVYQANDRPADRSLRATLDFCTGRARLWWSRLAPTPFVEFLLFWLGANVVWSAIVPAKAPRYWLPLYPPAILLAAHVLRQGMTASVPETGQRHLRFTWRAIYAVLGGVGVLALATGLVVAAAGDLTVGGTSLTPAWAWLVWGAGCLAVAAVEFSKRLPTATIGRCVGLIVVVLAFKPVLAGVWWPARAASDTQRHNAASLDELVPCGEKIYVLGRHELPDVAFYSHHVFQWIDHPADAAAFTDAPTTHYLLRTEDLDECVARHGFRFVRELEFTRADKQVSLIRIDGLESRMMESQ